MRRCSYGYTLVEVITVVAVIGILSVALSGPVKSWLSKSKVENASNEIYALMQLQKGVSVAKKSTARVRFDAGLGKLVGELSDAHTQSCEDDRVTWSEQGNPLVIPSNTSVVFLPDQPICFFRDGSSSGGRITIESTYSEISNEVQLTDKNVAQIDVFAATGFIELRRYTE
jgi:prepilin-type N-terminal cleavage/methylation domain-containing protein